MYDVIVIGAGPAGLTAGIYLARGGAKTLILEKEGIGGQIASSPLVENYPGYEQISGSELSDLFYEQVQKLGVDIEIDEVISIENGKIKKVTTNNSVYSAKAVIIATGVKHRLLGLKNENDLIGFGIHFCTTCDGSFYKNKTVAVVGGGNTAVINAIYLSNLCQKVYLICRGNKLKCENSLKEKVMTNSNVQVLFNSIITEYCGNKTLESVVIKVNNEKTLLKLDGIFLAIGMVPENNITCDIETNNNNYYLSNETLTNIEGIFVAGDCRDKEVRQVTTAVSDGTIAAIKALKYLDK